jgi:competence protein ComEC
MEILCFYAGVAFYYFKSIYPLYFLWIACFFRFKLAFFYWFIAAVILCVGHQFLIKETELSGRNVIPMAQLHGYITSIPIETAHKSQFQFLITKLNGKNVNITSLLSCYQHCPVVHAGEYWHVIAKLKKPINLANPGGFDYVSWLGSKHLGWVGTTKENSFKKLTSERNFFLVQYREILSTRLHQLVPEERILGVFEALTLGITNHISKSQWDLFRRTGTTHLIDISGEHIALVVAVVYWMIKFMWTRFGNCLRVPAPKVASVWAISLAFTYALIAGFSVPTQRAVIMCSLFLIRHFVSRQLSVWQIWRYSLLTVLVFEPHSVFMLGFYFSFIAVAILILINQRVSGGKVGKMLSMQFACLFGVMPLSLYWFSYASINGIVANIIAIPWVGLLIVPLALIIVLISQWVVLPGTISLLSWNISSLLTCLEWIDSFAHLNVEFTFTTVLVPLALMAGMSIALFLPISKLVPTILLLLLGSIFPKYERVAEGNVRVDVLDVGEGLAMVIRTAHHILIYDTGMQFFQSSDMGKLAIIPYLNTLGIKELDTIVISHPDLDHRGGLESLLKNYKVHELIVNDPSFYRRGFSCHNYPMWRWDGVSFQFFPLHNQRAKNNSSCILKVGNRNNAILLTGDIEKSAEHYLFKTYGRELASTVLVVPHHGSKTSSSEEFVAQVAPQYALVSYGFDNRYHFPHNQALMSYQLHHIPVYNTLGCGMIRVDFDTNPLKPTCHRLSSKKIFRLS